MEKLELPTQGIISDLNKDIPMKSPKKIQLLKDGLGAGGNSLPSITLSHQNVIAKENTELDKKNQELEAREQNLEAEKARLLELEQKLTQLQNQASSSS
eukprot:TRINITY_DN26912_c0_g1_i1.p1 TRINITY_DN26912_c0_g1~~TRINITY_DN26912_c0_g1_i1.p1  ORF type:complete len:109 (-),score=34.70 TRINITY_DN26912_c0_g1_i1:68-364(-)